MAHEFDTSYRVMICWVYVYVHAWGTGVGEPMQKGSDVPYPSGVLMDTEVF